MKATHTLRVVWPILNDLMHDDEAFAEAWLLWPGFPERFGAEVVGTPLMKVVGLSTADRIKFRAARAVVCEAPAVEKQAVSSKRKAA